MWKLTLAILFLLVAAAPAGAGPEEDRARLGGELTAMGANPAANADGSIPAWAGGVTKPPAGWSPGEVRVDVFGEDQPLFTIDASNVAEYADKLTDGQRALIESYDGYTMPVYPTRRSCAYADEVYERVKANVGVASVDEDCLLTGGAGSPLFPIPRTGCELIHNAKLGVYNGLWGFDRIEATIVPTRSGAFVPTRRRQALWLAVNQPRFPTFESYEGIISKSLSHTDSPPKQAGDVTLVHAQAEGHLKAWTYNPGQRRVRRAPNFEYDNPVPGWQGLVTVDQVNGFVGAADRYDWKILGQRELYVPYNNHAIFDKKYKYKDIVLPRYPRRDLMRYELHRVWIAEATVRDDKRHVMPRRVFYLDEDSWLILAADAYDARGELWRVSEHLPQLIYEVPACIATTSVYFDLVAGRYVVSPLDNEEEEADYLAGREGRMTDSGFSPDDIRRLGKR
jgi:hypothetical protein